MCAKLYSNTNTCTVARRDLNVAVQRVMVADRPARRSPSDSIFKVEVLLYTFTIGLIESEIFKNCRGHWQEL